MAEVQFGKPPGGGKNIHVLPAMRRKRVQQMVENVALGDVLTATHGLEIKKILLIETAGAPATAYVRLAPSGAADDVAHSLFYDVAVDAKETVVIDGPFNMQPSDVLRAQASTSDVAIHVSYDEEI